MALRETNPVKPNFLGIGPGKAGTTWLYQILKEHPQVGLAAAKETLFFTTEYERGLDWYLHLFRQCGGSRAVGEVSNTYFFDPAAAGRIHAFYADMKLISCLRNPVDRTFSHYLFLLRNNQVHGRFEDVVEASPQLLQKGEYARHLAPYLRCFPRDQLLILVFDDLHRRPERAARTIYTFIGVDEAFLPPSLHRRVLPASRARSPVLARLLKQMALRVRDLGRPEIVHRVKESRFVRLLYQPIDKTDYPVMTERMRVRLQDYFRADVKRLSGLLGRDMEELWFSGVQEGKAAVSARPDVRI